MDEQAHCTEHTAYQADCRYCRMRRRLQMQDEHELEREVERLQRLIEADDESVYRSTTTRRDRRPTWGREGDE